MAFEENRVYNKIILGQDGEGAIRKTVIDMTIGGDTPDRKDPEHVVSPIDADKILSATVTGTQRNEAWSSTGHLIEGTCMYNAATQGDTVAEADVLFDSTFHQAGTGAAETQRVGTMPNYRGVVGNEAETSEEKEKDVVIKPMTESAAAWENAEYIITGEGNDSEIGNTKIPSGAYGKNQTGAMTKIKVAGINYNLISNTTWLFGIQGRLQHNIEPDKRVDNPTLNEFFVTPSETYDAMAKVTIGDTPIEAKENPESSGSYTCYIGAYHA